MSKVMTKASLNEELFLKSVAKFKTAENKVGKVFLKNVISLGKLLHAEKKIWKPKKKWTEFLDQIDKTMAGANQYIRLYQYSLKNPDVLKRADLVNWERANSFLSLDDSLRRELAWSLDGKEVDQKAFKEHVRNIRHDDEFEEVEYLDDSEEEIRKKMIERIDMSKMDRAAKSYVVNLMGKNKDITENSFNVVAGLLYVSAGLEKLNKRITTKGVVGMVSGDKFTKLLTKIEAREWMKVLKPLIRDLQKVEKEINPIKNKKK